MNTSKNNRAFIIGNGESRKDFDLELLRNRGTIIGCNALYRDFEPDFLVTIDHKMEIEIKNSNFPLDRLIVPPHDEQYEPAEYNPIRPRSNAGMNAMLEAIRMNHKELYCIGFDFMYSDDRSVSNLYDGTNAYEKETRASFQDTVARVRYFDWFASQHKYTDFIMVYPPGVMKFRSLSSENVSGMTTDGLKKLLTD